MYTPLPFVFLRRLHLLKPGNGFGAVPQVALPLPNRENAILGRLAGRGDPRTLRVFSLTTLAFLRRGITRCANPRTARECPYYNSFSQGRLPKSRVFLCAFGETRMPSSCHGAAFNDFPGRRVHSPWQDMPDEDSGKTCNFQTPGVTADPFAHSKHNQLRHPDLREDVVTPVRCHTPECVTLLGPFHPHRKYLTGNLVMRRPRALWPSCVNEVPMHTLLFRDS